MIVARKRCYLPETRHDHEVALPWAGRHAGGWARARTVRLIDLPFVKVADAVALAGHEVHVCRYREARTLLRWLGPEDGADLARLRILDVAGGDGYWAGQARKRGARAVALDLDR